MKKHFASLVLSALVLTACISASRAEDAAAPGNQPAPATEAAPSTPPPVSVPRPSLAPKAEPTTSAPAATTADATPVRHRRYARRYRHRYYRTAYWEPFPIYWPHLYHHRIRWNRIPWIFSF